MLLAGHIKPWKDSTQAGRLDPRNGLAACPAHDVAFDTGMLTVNGGLRIHLARPLADAIQTDPLARHYYGKPPLHEVILLPETAQALARNDLDWHCQKVFITLNHPCPREATSRPGR
jgi:putative restriction endonuclease